MKTWLRGGSQMTKQNLLFIFSLALVCSFASAQSATVNAKKSIPPALMNTVQWEIQKNMSYTLRNEKSESLWTPKVIELQSFEGAAQPLFNPYQPNEIRFHLTFDVGMGHNMSDDIYYWRSCVVQLSKIEKTWGQPQITCDTQAE